MNRAHSRIIRTISIGAAVLVAAGTIAYAAIVTVRYDAFRDHIGLRGGAAMVTARVLRTPVGEIAGAWHYHPGYVYNVVTEGTITIEDGCGQIAHYSAGQAFETSEGRVHRAYNLGSVDAVEYNMFVGPWMTFNHPDTFDNQGACVAYVNHRERITLLVPEDPIR